MSDVRVVLMTAPSEDVASRIVTQLVEEQLVACGNVLAPVSSIYRWQGTMEHTSEVLVIMKTTSAAFPPLCDRIRELHPYDVPEILAIPVEGGLDAYLSWVRQSVASK